MKEQDQLQSFNRLIDLAQVYLVTARISEQEARIHEDLGRYSTVGYSYLRRASDLRNNSRQIKYMARACLSDAETINGRRHLAGKPTWPLSVALSGKQFKSWGAYRTLYSRSVLFRGVDPA